MRLVFILVMLISISKAKKKSHKTETYVSKLTQYSFTGKYETDNENIKKSNSKNTSANETNRPGDQYFANSEQTSEEKEIEKYIKLRGQMDTERNKKTWLDYESYFKGRENFYENSNFSDQSPPETTSTEQFLVKTAFDSNFSRRYYKHYNWTSCNEFGDGVVFHFRDVVNIDWVPFYAWSPLNVQEDVSYVHKFSYPDKNLVQKYKDYMAPYVNKTLDWKRRKLHMQSDLKMLLIESVNKKGEFDGIPYRNMKNDNHLDLINLRLKKVGSHLAMMYCEHRYATIMAVSGKEPTKANEIRSEAAKLKFKGRGYAIKSINDQVISEQSEEDWTEVE